MKRFAPLICLLGMAGLLSTGNVMSEEGKTMPSRQSLLKKEITLPTTQAVVNVVRVEFPSGFKTPLHTHEGQGPRYVIKGHLKIEDSGKTQVYGPGDVFWESGQEMTVENVGGSDAEFIIFEVAPSK